MPTDEQLAFWRGNGYLALPGFFTPDEVDRVSTLVEAIFREPPSYLVVDNTVTGKRTRLAELPADQRNPRTFKLNDLYLEHDEVRDLVLDARVRPILAGLLGEKAVLCNTLNFEKGSQQPEHIDSLFMTPRTSGKLVATWIALEDAHPDAGQLFYFPGSHTIPHYEFSDGSHHATDFELPKWHKYIRGKLEAGNYPREQFAAKKGDLFIWSADLVHGGSPRTDPARTRRSLVSHYFAESDCRALKMNCVPIADNAFWFKREHPPLPGTMPLRQRVGRLLRRLGLYRGVKKLIGKRAALGLTDEAV